jgi:hypothetical protein
MEKRFETGSINGRTHSIIPGVVSDSENLILDALDSSPARMTENQSQLGLLIFF